MYNACLGKQQNIKLTFEAPYMYIVASSYLTMLIKLYLP